MSDYLPKDVMQGILVRLTAKELVKCRAVCKSWDSLIKSPSFISTHLDHLHLQLQNDDDPCFIRLSRFKHIFSHEEEHYTLYIDNRVAAQVPSSEFQVNQRQRSSRQLQVRFPCTSENARVVAYRHGLLCFSPSPSSFVVWNPSLRKFFTIPPKPHTTTTTHSHSSSFNGVGFGFDSTTNDFKLLVGFDLYSLSSNSWKTIPAAAAATVPPHFRLSDFGSDVFIKGALHFLGSSDGKGKGEKLILGFDVGDEIFREIMLPKVLNTADDRSLKICKFGECIALSASVGPYYHVWVMNEYGSQSSWTKILDMADDLEWPPRMLGVWNNGGEILVERCGKIDPIDLKTGRRADNGCWTSRMYASIDTFVETLVLLDIGKDMSHYIDDVDETDDDATEDAW